jgi:phospholipase C
MTSIERRDFLRLAAGSLGAAALSGVLPAGVRRALAIQANNATGTIQDIEHIVILMQENRSFDHYFGTLRGVRGFGDPRPALLPGGQSVWYQPNGTGYVLPFHPPAENFGLTFLEDLAHDWGTTHDAWNNGNYNQWVAFKGTTTMAHYTRQDIPFHFALADAFTVCDAYHCSVMGPTDPNRYYMWTGWVGNDGSGGGPVIDNAEAGYGWSTYPERLQSAGISWTIYQDVGEGLDAANYWGWTGDNPYIGNYGDNSLLYFFQYQNATPGSPLFQSARSGTDIAQQGTLFDQLSADVMNNTLPQVSWIVPPEAFSEHPNWPANYGAWYTAQVLDILTSNADLWSKTALFITYDENDGFFDHLVPPVPPTSSSNGLSTCDVTNDLFAGNADYAAGPYGLGVRVPMLIVSPWTKGGWVCSQTFDHTSLVQFIEQRFGVMEPNITPWRRAVCGDLTSAFNFANPDASPPTLPSTQAYAPPDADRHDDYIPQVPVNQALPKQEPGQRPARALPYALSLSGRIDAGTGRYYLDFSNDGQAGAAFLVTAGNRSDGPWTYTVEAGKTLSDYWSAVAYTNGVYELSVHGPNGFLRSFGGDISIATADGGANPEITASYDTVGNALILQLANSGTGTCTLTISPNHYSLGAARTYQLGAGQSTQDVWALSSSANWYDLTITSDSDAGYTRRLAGHVETGAASFSDPAIGDDGDRIFGSGFE